MLRIAGPRRSAIELRIAVLCSNELVFLRYLGGVVLSRLADWLVRYCCCYWYNYLYWISTDVIIGPGTGTGTTGEGVSGHCLI